MNIEAFFLGKWKPQQQLVAPSRVQQQPQAISSSVQTSPVQSGYLTKPKSEWTLSQLENEYDRLEEYVRRTRLELLQIREAAELKITELGYFFKIGNGVVHHSSLSVHVQESTTPASLQHEKIVALRNQTQPVTFRKISVDLKLPLSSVQSEVAKHVNGKCSCQDL